MNMCQNSQKPILFFIFQDDDDSKFINQVKLHLISLLSISTI